MLTRLHTWNNRLMYACRKGKEIQFNFLSLEGQDLPAAQDDRISLIYKNSYNIGGLAITEEKRRALFSCRESFLIM